jgi:tRNA threonylcarbamoyladenosine biosynthesis protein TsaE
MITARTTSVDETRDLAAAIAELARPGDLVLLAGDLGAGKTAFAQGFGRGLGVKENITSPTFMLVRDYEGRVVLHHVDVYRLDYLQEVADLGMAELLDDGAVTLVEWGDAVTPALPADFLEIRLTYGTAENDRHLAMRTVGSSWSARSKAIWRAVDHWTEV